MIIPFILFSFICFSQNTSFDTLLFEGKAEFMKEFDKQNFEIAAEKLEKAITLRPDNAEAHYFLGYAYSRLNSKDGRSMIAMNLNLIFKSSAQFEMVNKLTPKYIGEIVSLDPYSKLTSEWGSMAMNYWHNSKPDSAVWAFKEGKKRGGFGDFYLNINRNVLDLCKKNSILISSGDNFTIPLWYLQIVEKYRTDVTVIDVSLLNTLWYPVYLVKTSQAVFGKYNEILDSIEYCQWADSTITIETAKNSTFSWLVKPSYLDNFLLRGDRLLLELLTANKFKREVYFTKGFVEEYRLSLKANLRSLVFVDRINYNYLDDFSFKQYETMFNPLTKCLKFLNSNSQDELNLIDMIRFDLFERTYNCLNAGDKQQAVMLMKLIDDKVNPKIYPFQSEQSMKFYEYLKQNI